MLNERQQEKLNGEDFADDLLIGAAAIAAYLKKTVKQVYHLAEKSDMPFSNFGSQLCLRKSALRRYFEQKEAIHLARGEKKARRA